MPDIGVKLPAPMVTLRTIAFDVFAAFGVTLDELKSRSRRTQLVKAKRHFVQRAYDAGYSPVEIERFLGKAHGTILRFDKLRANTGLPKP